MKHLLNKKDMKRLIIYSILSIAAIYTYGQSNFSKTDVKSIMKRVADWQIANPAKKTKTVPTMNG